MAKKRSRRSSSALQMTLSPTAISVKGGRLGDMAFAIGIIVAIVLAFGAATSAQWARNQWFGVILLVLGLVIGFTNIKSAEVGPFLLGSAALIIATIGTNLVVLNVITGLGTFVQAALNAFIMMIAPAAVVVSFKAVYKMAK